MRSRERTAGLLLFLVVSSLLTVSCSGGAKSTDAYGERGAVEVQGTAVTVAMKDIQFQPQGIKV